MSTAATPAVAVAAAPAATGWALDEFRYHGSSTLPKDETFAAGNGFGPFTLPRYSLREEILAIATPTRSYHINGCKGSGKSTLLKQLGDDLIEQEKSVYLFDSSVYIDRVERDILAKITEKKEAFFLIDETQANVNSPVFLRLLKNDARHRITTIGAGVPAFESLSSSFARKIKTSRLFVADEELASEGVIRYFVGDDTANATIRSHIECLLANIRSYVGGHVYPLMRLAELLVPKIKQEGQTADQVVTVLNSAKFRKTLEFQDIATRVSPSLQGVDIRAIFQPQQMHHISPAFLELKRRGFCNDSGKVVSMFLVDLYLSETGRESSAAPITTLSAGVSGVQDLLSWGTPRMDWAHYDEHGGAVEDALTFELLRSLSCVHALGVMLFNPKLVTAGTASRRPDIYFDSDVHCYVECVLTKANNKTAQKDVEQHILRFFAHGSRRTAHYEIHGANFAILHYQDWGNYPMQLEDDVCRQCFDERVFTFLMKTKELYLGNMRISGL